MSAFWMIGIGVNLVVMAAVVYWAVRSWRRSNEAARRTPDEGDR